MRDKIINKTLSLIKEALETEMHKQEIYRVETLKDMIECLTDIYKKRGNIEIVNTKGYIPTISVNNDDTLTIY